MSQQLSVLADAWCAGKQKVACSLTDRFILQELFEQQGITVMCTIHFHLSLHENHISAPQPSDTD